MAKQLKIWNGGDWEHSGGHVWVAAYSRAEVSRLVSEAYSKIHNRSNQDFNYVTVNEIKDYYTEGCWGDAMNGIEPERGVWWAKANVGGVHGKPERII